MITINTETFKIRYQNRYSLRLDYYIASVNKGVQSKVWENTKVSRISAPLLQRAQFLNIFVSIIFMIKNILLEVNIWFSNTANLELVGLGYAISSEHSALALETLSVRKL